MTVPAAVAPFIGDPIAWRRHKIDVLKGKICFGGLDLGVVNDFTCLALFFPKQAGVPTAVLLLWAWVPANVDYHTVLKERYGYDDWVRGEFVKLTPGERTDYAIVRDDILALDARFHIQELAFDKAYATQIVQELTAGSVTMVEHGQGTYAMTYPIKEFQRQIVGRDFLHGQNPLLTFMVDNLVVKSDGKGNLCCVKPDNPNSPRKIDGAVASIMAIGRASANPGATAAAPRFLFI
jgi:phage terminase large subunit-like protein